MRPPAPPAPDPLSSSLILNSAPSAAQAKAAAAAGGRPKRKKGAPAKHKDSIPIESLLGSDTESDEANVDMDDLL